MPDFVHEIGADVLNLIPVDAHCGDHLLLRRADIEEYNTRIAPVIADRGLALGVLRAEREAYPFGLSVDEIRLGKRGEYAMGWYERNPCFAPWTHSLIDFDGKVYVCCMTREQITPLGDLREQSFGEIWRGAGYSEVRQAMHPPRLGPCRKCDDYLEENRALLQISLDRRTHRSPSRPTYSPA